MYIAVVMWEGGIISRYEFSTWHQVDRLIAECEGSGHYVVVYNIAGEQVYNSKDE